LCKLNRVLANMSNASMAATLQEVEKAEVTSCRSVRIAGRKLKMDEEEVKSTQPPCV
jgi:hypothetical protein